jgi:hypothetical protein
MEEMELSRTNDKEKLNVWWKYTKSTKRKGTVQNGLDAENAMQFWTDRFKKQPLDNENALEEEVQNWLADNQDRRMDAITTDELEEAIALLPNNKAAGQDGILSEMLKALNEQTRGKLLQVLNKCIELEVTPTEWKLGKMVLLFKKGDVTDPANYRPITILSQCRKLLEIIIWKRIAPLVNNDNSRISVNQAGFRQNRGCLEQVMILHRALEEGKHLREQRWITFVDFKQAYDSISHTGLLYKLKGLGFPASLVRWIQNLIQGGKNTLLGITNSRSFNVERGVPQGSVLSPFLFNCYINEVAKSREIKQLGVRIQNRQIGTTLYADDTALIASSKVNCKKQIQWLSAWAQKWGMEIHPGKTEVMVYAPQCRRTGIRLNNQLLKQCNEYIYLGVKLQVEQHKELEKEIVEKARRRFLQFTTVFQKYGQFSGYFKRTCYTHIIRPMLLFGSEIYKIPKQAISLEREISRSILGTYNNISNVAVRRAVGLWSIESWGDLLFLLFLFRMSRSPNPTAKDIVIEAINHHTGWIGQRIAQCQIKYNIDTRTILTDEELTYIQWGNLIREKLVQLDLVSASSLNVYPAPSDLTSDFRNRIQQSLYSREFTPYHPTKERSSAFVETAGKYTKIGFMGWINRMNPRDVEERTGNKPGPCYICCREESDTPNHLVECPLQNPQHPVRLENTNNDIEECRQAQRSIQRRISGFNLTTFQEFIHAGDYKQQIKDRIHKTLKKFQKLFAFRTEIRKRVLAAD